MDKEEIKNRIDFNNIGQKNIDITGLEVNIQDYLIDYEGNYIIPLTPLDMKLIEEIQLLKERIKKLEEVK